jgi:GAF domain-containing protein
MDARIEFERLRALHETGLLSASAPPPVKAVCQQAQAHFGVRMALVTLIDRERQVVKVGLGTDLEGTPRSEAFCDHTIRSDAVLVVPDAREDARFTANPLVTGEPFVRFYAGAPLIYLRKIRLGALCLLDTRPRQFSRGDRAELAAMAEEVVGEIVTWQFERRPTIRRR